MAIKGASEGSWGNLETVKPKEGSFPMRFVGVFVDGHYFIKVGDGAVLLMDSSMVSLEVLGSMVGVFRTVTVTADKDI